jgi:hypothetical protein
LGRRRNDEEEAWSIRQHQQAKEGWHFKVEVQVNHQPQDLQKDEVLE